MALGAGGGDLGTGYVKVKPDATGFGSELENQVGAEADRSGGALGRRTSMAFAGAFTAGTAALGKSVMDFAGFDAGMREIFTLMPGISGPAMDEMTQQVKDFSSEFGVLPTETVPALYEALGAGVPADNVFAFLETAQKLAKGGATDLATAVDGLSSVTNAYGSDVIDATKASDIMFKTVGLGKGTVDEVAGSLFQVTPIAAAMGVSFEDVGAALATLTAAGTPVSVAATQIRGVIGELGKDGTKASDAFAEMSGKTFPQFIAEGGNLAGALGIMQEAADANGGSLIDMFGSIEAGQAALGLMKEGGAGFVSAIEQMENSAGSTQAAFDTMNTGLAATMDRLKARFAVVFLDIGETIAPQVEAIGESVAGLLELFGKLPAGLQTGILLGATLFAGLVAFAGPLLKAIQLFKMLGSTMSLLAANPWVLVALAIAGIAYLIITNWEEVSAFFVELGETIPQVWDDVWTATFEFTTNIYNAITGTFDEIATFFVDYWPYLLGIFTGGAGLLVGLIVQNWDAIWNKTTEVTSGIANLFASAFQTAYNTVTSVGGQIVGWIVAIPGKITSAFTTLADTISAPFRTAFAAIKSAWNSTVGGFGFTVPGWIPEVGGKSFKIPSMATGGLALEPMLAMIGDAGPRDPEVVSPVSLMRETVAAAIQDTGGGTPFEHHTHLHVDGNTDPTTFERMLERASVELVRVAQRELNRQRQAGGEPRGALV